jgi:hypothetical protein
MYKSVGDQVIYKDSDFLTIIFPTFSNKLKKNCKFRKWTKTNAFR